MAIELDVSPLKRFLEGVAGDPTPGIVLWQVGVAAAAVLLAFLVARAITRQFKPGARWKFGEGDFERVAYPFFAYVFLAVGKLLLEPYQRVALLEILQSLLLAWLVIRAAVYVLGHVLPQGSFLRASIRAIAWVAWVGVALHVTGLLPAAIAALDGIGFAVGKEGQRISLWLVMQALAALALALTVAAWISSVTESRVLAAEHLEISTRVVISKFVRVVTLFLAVLVALPLVGIDITALSVFSGALGVGLGFGLQKIASNYVSGFIVLLDRSLRIGDIITVDGRKGTVRAIESRYTVIRAGDGNEAIIPNEMLIAQPVVRHTYADPRVSVVVEVGVSYESDVERAAAILREAALRQPRVLREPAPVSRVTRLGESAVEMQLVAWIADPASGDADLRSDLLRDVLRAFRQAEIEIPYPRRDVHLVATAETPVHPVQSST